MYLLKESVKAMMYLKSVMFMVSFKTVMFVMSMNAFDPCDVFESVITVVTVMVSVMYKRAYDSCYVRDRLVLYMVSSISMISGMFVISMISLMTMTSFMTDVCDEGTCGL
jgi:hypothetical protein